MCEQLYDNKGIKNKNINTYRQLSIETFTFKDLKIIQVLMSQRLCGEQQVGEEGDE